MPDKEYYRKYQLNRRRRLKLLDKVWSVFINHAREIAALPLTEQEREILDQAWDFIVEKKSWEEVVKE